jgi:N-acetylmuramoyl-L-alanine amidase
MLDQKYQGRADHLDHERFKADSRSRMIERVYKRGQRADGLNRENIYRDGKTEGFERVYEPGKDNQGLLQHTYKRGEGKWEEIRLFVPQWNNQKLETETRISDGNRSVIARTFGKGRSDGLTSYTYTSENGESTIKRRYADGATESAVKHKDGSIDKTRTEQDGQTRRTRVEADGASREIFAGRLGSSNPVERQIAADYTRDVESGGSVEKRGDVAETPGQNQENIKLPPLQKGWGPYQALEQLRREGKISMSDAEMKVEAERIRDREFKKLGRNYFKVGESFDLYSVGEKQDTPGVEGSELNIRRRVDRRESYILKPALEVPDAPERQRRAQDKTNGRYAPGSVDRSRFDSELSDPAVMRAFAGRMKTEVGSQGAAAQLAWAETVMNRAVSRNQTLIQALTGRYYPTHSPGSSNRPDLIAAIKKAWLEGTDTTSGSTGNASGSVGFGRRGKEVIRINGEKFGYEEVDLGRGWLKKYRQLKVPAAGSAGETGAVSPSDGSRPGETGAVRPSDGSRPGETGAVKLRGGHRPVVVLDSGHGGHDSGATVGGVKEKDVNHDISDRVAKHLRRMGISVERTNPTGDFQSLGERSRRANRDLGGAYGRKPEAGCQADAFVSIHANSDGSSHGNGNARGVETYYYRPKAQDGSAELARSVHESVVRSGDIDVKDRGVRDNKAFSVIRNTQVPAILLETGFLTNAQERANLASPEYRERMAGLIAKGIARYLDGRAPRC